MIHVQRKTCMFEVFEVHVQSDAGLLLNPIDIQYMLTLFNICTSN